MTKFASLTLSAICATSIAIGAPVKSVGPCYEKIGPMLAKSGGVPTPEIKRVYVQWAEDTILEQLRVANRYPSDDLIADADQDDATKQALFGAVYPPDPSILQNYGALRTQMGKPFCAKYHSLALAFAVARRTKGVIPVDSEEIGQENQISSWADWPLMVPKTPEEKTIVQHIGSFLKDTGNSAADLYNTDATKQKLISYLKDHNYDTSLVPNIKIGLQFGEWIKNAMIVAGQRPKARDPRPIAADWLHQIVGTYETTPKSTPPGVPWPLFPVKSAPWPLLMPLVHTVPLKEAQWIWEAFLGGHGEDRFHTYGPYRVPLIEMPYDMAPSKWFWDAFPDRLLHGGMCIPISKGAVDLYSTLGEPAMAAAQPGHSNLITFQNDNHTWKANVEQDFAGGPRVTYAQWFFNDDTRSELDFRGLYGWAGAEYHLGLALGMNLGVDFYLNARIDSNIFQAMPETDQKTLGRTVLLHAILENPYDPDPWYRIFPISNYDQKFQLARAIRARNPAGLIPDQRCAALDDFLRSNRLGPVGDDLNGYWGVLEEFTIRNFVLTGEGPHDEATMMKDFQFLQGATSIGPQELADFAEKFVGGSGPEILAADTEVDRKLAEKGDAYGRFRMAQRYLAGDGVPQDFAKSKELFTEGVKAGDPIAAVLIDRMNPQVSTDGMVATASTTYSETQSVKHLLDGSGMVGNAHDNSVPAATMWSTIDNPPLSYPAPGIPLAPAWVRIDFPHPQWFDAIEIWNQNQLNLTDRGIKRLQIYGSVDGTTWLPLTRAAQLPRASGAPNDEGSILENSSSRTALKSVMFVPDITDGNYGGNQYGLSAIRFIRRSLQPTLSGGQMTVTTSSQLGGDQSPRHLVDGSGLTGEFHDNGSGRPISWQTVDPAPMGSPAPGLMPSPAWARFDFSQPCTFDEITIWNYNDAPHMSKGFRRTRILGTSNGSDWFPLTPTEVVVLPKATGGRNSSAIHIVNVEKTRKIKSVIVAADYKDGNWGNPAYGLASVKFISHW